MSEHVLLPNRGFSLPSDRQRHYRRARRLERWTIVWMVSVLIVMYFAMGTSQAMQAAWIEDILSLVPPLAFLCASRFEFRPPNRRFPFGYLRSMQIAMLCASVALLLTGFYLVVNSAISLIKAEHPTIGIVVLFDHPVWAGWVMIAALLYGMLPPLILGRKKLDAACELVDDVLNCDADMNRADWATAAAGVVGVGGIAVGWWWADAAAAGVIGLTVVRDGVAGTTQVVSDLMDHVPTKVGSFDTDPLPRQLQERLEALDWVEAVELRLREQGRVITGTAYVVAQDDTHMIERIEEAEREAEQCHWRFHDIRVRPVSRRDSSISAAEWA